MKQDCETVDDESIVKMWGKKWVSDESPEPYGFQGGYIYTENMTVDAEQI